MCEQLSQLRRATLRYTAGFDPETVSAAQAARVVAEANVIESAISTLKALAAARAAEGSSWKESGHRSAAEALAHDTGTSMSSARELLEVGRRLKSQPEIDAAARGGNLSSTQVQMITNAVEADPSAERRLLDEAARSSLSSLKDACASTKAKADLDPQARRQKIRAQRSLRSWTDIEGVWRLSACGNPEDGAHIMSALAPITEALFHEARKEGRRERREAYGFDALVEMAKESMSTSSSSSPRSSNSLGSPPRKRKGAPVKLLVRAELEDLLAGAPKDRQTVELVGYGPISKSALDDLLGTRSPLVAAILTKAQAVVGVAHLSRAPNSHQQSALEWLYPSCAAEGCPAQARLERDHRIDWFKTRFTMFDLLDLLCSHHHDLKTRENWQLVEGRGKRPFVPPDDPRHPRHKQRSRENPATGPPKRAA